MSCGFVCEERHYQRAARSARCTLVYVYRRPGGGLNHVLRSFWRRAGCVFSVAGLKGVDAIQGKPERD